MAAHACGARSPSRHACLHYAILFLSLWLVVVFTSNESSYYYVVKLLFCSIHVASFFYWMPPNDHGRSIFSHDHALGEVFN